MVLMLGQVALAEHSASHLDHSFSKEIVASHEAHDGHHHNKKDNRKHQCPECLLVHSLQVAFYHIPATLPGTLSSEVLLPQQYHFETVLNHYKANPPRAPPTILI